MALFKIGDRVLAKEFNVQGIVIEVKPANRGRQQYVVKTDNGSETSYLEPDLTKDIDREDPFELCRNGIFGNYSEFSQINTTSKIRSSNISTISSLKASKTLFRAYQYKPLLKFINSPNRRLLIADEVGLGKTIEAGHIMLELKARGQLRNVLIVCPKSLQEKWKEELKEKFALNFKIIEHSEDLIADLSSGQGAVRAIVTYEKIRRRRGEKDGEGASKKSLTDYLDDSSQRFSLVLCDEAHKLRNSGTATYKGANVLMDRADAAVFLTATPIMISKENLYNLLHLLDNKRFSNYYIFENRLNENQPFIKAIEELNTGRSLKDIGEGLASAIVRTEYNFLNGPFNQSIDDLYAENPVYSEIKDLMSGDDSYHTRVRLQYLLSTMSVMSNEFSRTRKREVTTDMSQAERHPHLCTINLYSEEREQFENVIDEYVDDSYYYSGNGGLGLVQCKRQISSSVWGYLNDEDSLDKGVDEYAEYGDAKIDELIKIIKEVFTNSDNHKLIVFAVFRRTLKYLKLRLLKAGYNSLVIHGQIKERAEVIQQFKTDNTIHILLSSEVGSEGLDLQFCNVMVNYDLPWNPMVVEQRIGRIDRFGQKSPIVNIYNMVVKDSIHEEIYTRLLDRIGIFRSSIGDLEAIFDAPITVDGKEMTIQDGYNQMEQEFFTQKLSEEERKRKTAEIEKAIIAERDNLERISEGLNGTLTSDAYFRGEIDRILRKKAYVTESELRRYMEEIIDKELTMCNIDETEREKIFSFKIPQRAKDKLKNFFGVYGSKTEDAERRTEQFKHRIDELTSLSITFDQSVAYENPQLEYVNIYHPIIQAGSNYFIKNAHPNEKTFCFALRKDESLHAGDIFYLALYQLNMQHMVREQERKTTELVPIVFNVQTTHIEQDSELVDKIYSCSQEDGSDYNLLSQDLSDEVLDRMDNDFVETISEISRKRQKEVRMLMESDRQRSTYQVQEFYQSKIEELKQRIWEHEEQLNYVYSEDEKRSEQNSIKGMKAHLKMLNNRKDDELKEINKDPQLSVDHQLLTLCFIKII